MSDPDQQNLPTMTERFTKAHNDYIEARTAAIECLDARLPADAQAWATLAAAAAMVLAEPVPHCSKCCY